MAPRPSQLSSAAADTHSALSPLHAGGIPAGWAAPGSFEALRVASLGGQQLGGTLPPEWGSGLPALELLDVSNAELEGPLPPQWGSGLPALKEM